MGIQEMDYLNEEIGDQATRIQKKVIGSSRYATSQICICDFCGMKIVDSVGGCAMGCPKCGANMRTHDGMKRHTAAPSPDPDDM